MEFKYDVIVIGAGHAGCEAAAAAANLGSKTCLITMDMNKIGQMSCNPAVGGIAKGQIVREVDALGGYMGLVTDQTAIQFRILNRSKGPAMWSPRAQCDRNKFIWAWREILENTIRSCAQRSAQASISSWCSGFALILGIRLRLNRSSSILDSFFEMYFCISFINIYNKVNYFNTLPLL